MKARANPHPAAAIPQSLSVATALAARLTKAEIREAMIPMRTAATYLRAGAGSEAHLDTFVAHLHISRAIEVLRYVRGIAGHTEAAMCACSTIRDRATYNGTRAWVPVEPTFHELDAIAAIVDLYAVQLQQLTGGDLRNAVRRATADRQAEISQAAKARAITTTMEAST